MVRLLSILPISFRVTSWFGIETVMLLCKLKQPWRIWVNKSHGYTKNRWYNHCKTKHSRTMCIFYGIYRADSRIAPSQWETPLQSNAVSHWLGAILESALDLLYMSTAHAKLNSSIWEPFQHKRCHLTNTEIPTIKIRQSDDHRIFIMEIPIPGKIVFFIETGWDTIIP